MNQSHYPDLERCRKLTELGFPKTERVMTEILDILIKARYVCPSVMEMMDVLPEKFAINAINEDFPNRLADIVIRLIDDGHLTFDKR